MPVQAEPAEHDRVEVAREEVREVEGRRLGVVELQPRLVAREKAVAVVAG